MKNPIPILSLCLALFISCSVQKRKYQNGFYVDWHSKNSQPEKKDPVAKKFPGEETMTTQDESVVVEARDQEIMAAAGDHIVPLKQKKQPGFIKSADDTCDVLVYKDGSEIRVKVLEVGISEVKYKRCDALDGPMYISRKSELFMIKYANGTREVIKSELPEVKAPSQTFNQYKNNKYRRENHPLALASLVLGILSIVLAYIVLFLIAAGLGPGVLVLPVLAGLAAVFSGRTAMNRIREQPDLYKGKGMAIPGFIMGMVILGIFAFAALIAFLLI